MAWGEAATVRPDVVQAADPFVRVTVPQAEIVVPSAAKLTVPPGVPLPGETALTLAVKVTGCPNVDGFAEAVTAVAVAAWLTWCAAVPELPPKLASPPYVAVSVFAPAVVEVRAQLPDPLLRLAIVQLPVPSVTVTDPVGVPMNPPTAIRVDPSGQG